MAREDANDVLRASRAPSQAPSSNYQLRIAVTTLPCTSTLSGAL